MTDLISVIVPIYKVEAYLDECIRSIVKQTYPFLDIILVDDGSPDRCGEMCDAWAAKDSRVKVIHKPNGGLSDARNAGLRIAVGDYIAFVDSDDWIEPQMYEKMLAAMKAEQADICACRIAECHPERRSEWGCPKNQVTDPEQTLAMLYNEASYPVAAWNKLYRRELWETLRFPVGKICEDAFTTYLLIHKAKRIVQLSEAFYNYRIRPESIMTSRFSIKRMDEEEVWRVNYEFMREHYPRIYPAAFGFYLEKVNVLIHCIPRDSREEFAEQYCYLKKILSKNLLYILLRCHLGLKQRIRIVLDYSQL